MPDYLPDDDLSESIEALKSRLAEVSQRLALAEQTLRAISAGEVDAVFEPGSDFPLLLKNAQEALARSDTRFRRLMASMGAVVFELSPQGDMLTVSPEVTALTGYTSEELLSRQGLNLLLPGEFAPYAAAFLERMARGDVVNYELPVRAKNGETVFLEINSANAYRPDGSLERALCIAVNIARRLPTASRTDISARLLEQREESLQAGSFQVVYPSREMCWSAELYRICGLPPGSPLEPGVVAGLIHPDDRQRVEHLVKTAVAERKAYTLEFRIRRPDQSVRSLQLFVEPEFDSAGRLTQTTGVILDLTERRTVELQLREQSRLLDALLENMGEAMVVINRQEQFVLFNQAARELHGAGRADISSIDWAEVFGRTDQNGAELFERDRLPLIRALNGEQIDNEEMFVRRFSDGKRINILVTARPLRNDQGEIVAAIAVYRDISDLRRIEADLIEREKRLRLILEKTPAVTWSVDPNLVLVTAIGSPLGAIGLREEDVVGRSMLDFYEPDSAPVLSTQRALSGSPATFMHSFGSRVFQCYVEPLSNSETITGAFGVSLDITELELAQRNLIASQTDYRRMIETSEEGVWIVDAQARTTFVNRRMAELLQYQPEEMIGRPIYDFMDDQARIESERHIGLRMQGRHETYEFRYRRKDGTNLWAIVSAAPILGPSGEYIGGLGMVTDLTERKQTEMTMQRQTAFMRLLQDITMAANEAVDIDRALQFAIDRVCAETGWVVGHAFLVHGQVVESTRVWHLSDPQRFEAFRVASERADYSTGGGLIRTVIKRVAPAWWQDVTAHAAYQRSALAKDSQIKTGVAFPVLVGKQVAAVLEFYSEKSEPPDDDLLAVMGQVGTQLGRVIERRRAQDALAGSEARFRAIFQGTSAGFALLDEAGRVREANPALCEILGYTASELVSEPHDQNNPLSRLLVNMGLVEAVRGATAHEITFETPFSRRDGTRAWGRLAVSLLGETPQQPALILAMLEDITARKAIEAELTELQQRMTMGREAERITLSQDIHDGPMQELYGVTYRLKAIYETNQAAFPDGSFDEVDTTIQRVIDNLRTICGDLRPPALTPFGLEKAIRSHIAGFVEKHPELDISLDLEPDGQALSEPVRLAFFRIYQQALANVARHAGASFVAIRLKLTDDEARLEISDDGSGFELPARWIELARRSHFGLVGMLERAQAVNGSLQVITAPGEGTTVRVSAPYGK